MVALAFRVGRPCSSRRRHEAAFGGARQGMLPGCCVDGVALGVRLSESGKVGVEGWEAISRRGRVRAC